jgi:hypothetical protein
LGQRGRGGAFEPRVLLSANYPERLLYRTAGIPARVSQGYAVAARQRGHGASLLIRSGDAHAWPEIYLQGAG